MSVARRIKYVFSVDYTFLLFPPFSLPEGKSQKKTKKRPKRPEKVRKKAEKRPKKGEQ